MPRRTPLASLVAALLLTGACAGPPTSSPSTLPQPAPASPAGSAAAGSAGAGSAIEADAMSGIDVVFLSTMVGHSERTLQIVRLARDRVRDDALRTLAAAVEATEADELAAMRGWLPTTGPGASATAHHHDGHGDDAALDRLRTAPDADVDRVLRERARRPPAIGRRPGPIPRRRRPQRAGPRPGPADRAVPDRRGRAAQGYGYALSAVTRSRPGCPGQRGSSLMETELTQCRVSFGVKPSPWKTCPR